MLFSVPRTGYLDGTYIREDGNHKRLNDYLIEPLDFITESTTGFKFSNGWRVTFKQEKEKEYWVKPIADGQLNLFFIELLAEVVNREDDRVGYCVVELLPGARNKRIKPLMALKRES